MTKYTTKLQIPQYNPSTKPPKIEDCIITTQVDKFLKDIQSMTISESEKKFLTLCAYRFYKYDYSKIADYYCLSASEQMQDMMERLAVIIVDYNNALKNGFVHLSKSIEASKESSND